MLKTLIQFIIDLIYPLFRRVLPFQLYAYLAVGAINTALNIGLFALLYQSVLPPSGINMNGLSIASYTISLVVAFILTVPTGFWLARHFAFNQGQTDTQQDGRRLGKYFLVVLQGLGSDYLIMKGLIVFFGVYPTVAKIVSTVIVLSMNYLLQKYFTFTVKKVA